MQKSDWIGNKTNASRRRLVHKDDDRRVWGAHETMLHAAYRLRQMTKRTYRRTWHVGYARLNSPRITASSLLDQSEFQLSVCWADRPDTSICI